MIFKTFLISYSILKKSEVWNMEEILNFTFKQHKNYQFNQ